MQFIDYLVIAAYFLLMAGIGFWVMRSVHGQEDFFLGGRGFGKVMQAFAAFGAGTGSSDPVNVGRTTFSSGMSGMWSVMYWLFVTPFYWITGVWYRRMRHLTLGDWYVERYESRHLGLAYALFGLLYYIVYGSMLFSAIGKVAAPMIGHDGFEFSTWIVPIEAVLVPLIGVVVLVYGLAGGLRAAYLTDMIQGICIVVLSLMLIPHGLEELVQRFGDPNEAQTWRQGLRILHERLPPEHFSVIGASSSSEFPLYRIAAIVLINLIGIVVTPHFIATGGGSARTEMDARVGLVVGNFLKRFCTVGWVFTGLIGLALFADSPELLADPDRTWGVASRELLMPGLRGLMLACLLAALMSSIDAYMIVCSGLVVRHVYAAYINPDATESVYVTVARVTGAIVVGGSVCVSLWMMDVFRQLQLTWIIPVIFAAPFWVGMYWRRATTSAAWISVCFCTLFFFVLPKVLPIVMPQMRTVPTLATTTPAYRTVRDRLAAPTDVARRQAEITTWERLRQMGRTGIGDRPPILPLRDPVQDVSQRGGKAVFWSGGVTATQDGVPVLPIATGETRDLGGGSTEQRLRFPEGTQFSGHGDLRLDLLLYHWCGLDLAGYSDAMIDTLGLPTKIVLPFVVMIVASLLTPRHRSIVLDRYYIKMRTPVAEDPQTDLQRLEDEYAHPERSERQKIFPRSDLEFCRPSRWDVIGFVISWVVCFAVIGLAYGLAQWY